MEQNWSEAIASLQAEVGSLRSLAQLARRVDLVDWGQIRVFMYTDDSDYRRVHSQYKGALPNRRLMESVPLPRYSPDALFAEYGSSLIRLVLAHHWLRNLDFLYIDVGCQYGSAAIEIGQLIESCNQGNLVVAFEPGSARTLVPHNIEINHMRNRVLFEPLVVGDGSYPTILFGEIGHSENNRTVNRDLGSESFSYVVESTSIDDYLARNGFGQPLILKIDTQGAEPRVLHGMRRAIAERLVTALIEFTPAALCDETNPVEWLQMLGQTHLLFDTDGQDCFRDCGAPVIEVLPEQYGELVSRTLEKPVRNTDLLLLPKAMPGLPELVRRITLS